MVYENYRSERQTILVYLTKGVHEIKLEATLGSFTEILSRVENTAIGLNELYRKIIMITGTSPDLYRDYFLEEQIPGLVKTLLKFSNELEEEATLFEKLAGQKGGEAEFLRRVALQLRSMAEDTDSIPSRISNFRDNLSGLSSWLAYRRDQPLEIDYILVASPEAKLPSPTASMASKFINSLKAFIYSFIEDYTNIGEVYEGQR